MRIGSKLEESRRRIRRLSYSNSHDRKDEHALQSVSRGHSLQGVRDGCRLRLMRRRRCVRSVYSTVRKTPLSDDDQDRHGGLCFGEGRFRGSGVRVDGETGWRERSDTANVRREPRCRGAQDTKIVSSDCSITSAVGCRMVRGSASRTGGATRMKWRRTGLGARRKSLNGGGDGQRAGGGERRRDDARKEAGATHVPESYSCCLYRHLCCTFVLNAIPLHLHARFLQPLFIPVGSDEKTNPTLSCDSILSQHPSNVVLRKPHRPLYHLDLLSVWYFPPPPASNHLADHVQFLSLP